MQQTLNERQALTTECTTNFARVVQKLCKRMRAGEVPPVHFRDAVARLSIILVAAGDCGALQAEKDVLTLLETLTSTARQTMYI